MLDMAGPTASELEVQQRLLGRLLAWCQQDDDVRWLTVGCSLARGDADCLSDLDVVIGLREEHFEDSVGRVRQALAALDELVESYDYLMPLGFPCAASRPVPRPHAGRLDSRVCPCRVATAERRAL